MSSKNVLLMIDTVIENTVDVNKLICIGDTINLQAKLYENGVAKNLTGESVTLIIKKSDGTLVENSLLTSGNNEINKILSDQVTTFPGKLEGQLTVTNQLGQRCSTNIFTMEVKNIVGTAKLPTSESDIQSLIDLTNLITQANNAINIYGDSADAIAGTKDAIEALQAIQEYYNTNNPLLTQNIASAISVNGNLIDKTSEANTTITNLTNQNNKAKENIEALEKYGGIDDLVQEITYARGKYTNLNERLENISTTIDGSLLFKDFNTTESINLYVDQSNGSDESGDGTQEKPYSSVERAWNEIPFYYKNSFKIIITGDYSSDISLSVKNSLNGKNIVISSDKDLYTITGNIRANFNLLSTYEFNNIKLKGFISSNKSSLRVINCDINVESSNLSLYLKKSDVYIQDTTISNNTNGSSCVHALDDTFVEIWSANLNGILGIKSSTCSSVVCRTGLVNNCITRTSTDTGGQII